MKFTRKILCLLLTLATLVGMMAFPIEAKPISEQVNGSAGQVITVEFEIENTIAFDGVFTYSHPELFTAVELSVSDMIGFYNPENGRADYFGVTAADNILTLTLTLAEDAEIGDSCEITFQYETTSTGYLPSTPDYITERVTVTVVKGIDYSALQAALARADSLTKDDYTDSSWAKMMAAVVYARKALSSDDQSEVDRAANELNDAIDALVKISVDYSALKKQIRIAEDLDESDYTATSWSNMISKLSVAREALNSKSQNEVDNATANLKAAINALVRANEPSVSIDYTELRRQIARAEALNAGDYTPETWAVLADALADAREALSSTLQRIVDDAAKSLNDAIGGLKKIDAIQVDYTELLKQIAIAEGLTLTDYTAESRNALLSALETAREALTSYSQSEIDSATAALKDAIAKLKRMDFSALLAAIAEVEKYGESGELAELWMQMHALLSKAQELMASGDQAAVDQCAVDILSLLEQLIAKMQETGKTQIVEVEKPVPTEPEGDYCNMNSHPIWQILFWVSLALNVIIGLIIGGFFLLRRRKLSDDTPLVDYDIEDDAE